MPEFKLPDLGEGVTEGEVVEWRVREGATVRRDEVLVVVGTDKATVEIPSPFEGRVEAILAPEGARVQVGDPLVRVESGAEGSAPGPTHVVSPASAPPRVAAPPLTETVEQRSRALPSVRRAARQRGMDADLLTGSGPQGRVRMEDLLGLGRRVPLRGAARVMAERMTEVHRIVPQVTVVIEADMAPLEAWVAGGTSGGSSILGLICLAAVAGLLEQPVFNASFDDRAIEVVFHDQVQLGIAIQTDDGLRVATLRGADRMAPDRLQAELGQLVARARSGRLGPEELSSSTFTISSGGKLGGLLATPLVNWPNLAILGVHAIEDRAVVRDGRVEVGRRANLSLSFDHRVIDGMTASGFLHRVAARLQEPEKLLPSPGRQAGAETGS